MREYLLFDAQPPARIPMTEIPLMARKYTSPTFRSAGTSPLPKGQHDEQEERGGQDEKRRCTEERPVGRGRDDVLLDEQLSRVGEGLQEPPRSHAVGPPADLHPGGHLALEPDDEQGVDREEHCGRRRPAQLEKHVQDHGGQPRAAQDWCAAARQPSMRRSVL